MYLQTNSKRDEPFTVHINFHQNQTRFTFYLNSRHFQPFQQKLILLKPENYRFLKMVILGNLLVKLTKVLRAKHFLELNVIFITRNQFLTMDNYVVEN